MLCNNCPFRTYMNNTTNSYGYNHNQLPKCLKCDIFNNIYLQYDNCSAESIVEYIKNYGRNVGVNEYNINGVTDQYLYNCINNICQQYIPIFGETENILVEVIKDIGEETILEIMPDCAFKNIVELCGTIKAILTTLTSTQNKNYHSTVAAAKIIKILCKYCDKKNISLLPNN